MPVGRSYRVAIPATKPIPSIREKSRQVIVKAPGMKEVKTRDDRPRTEASSWKLDRMAEKMRSLGMSGWEYLTLEDLRWAPKRWFYPTHLPPPTDPEFYKEHPSPTDYPPGFLPKRRAKLEEENRQKRRSIRDVSPSLGCTKMRVGRDGN